jgi:hypothetical protein
LLKIRNREWLLLVNILNYLIRKNI